VSGTFAFGFQINLQFDDVLGILGKLYYNISRIITVIAYHNPECNAFSNCTTCLFLSIHRDTIIFYRLSQFYIAFKFVVRISSM
jgi:hypothetical protein